MDKSYLRIMIFGQLNGLLKCGIRGFASSTATKMRWYISKFRPRQNNSKEEPIEKIPERGVASF